MLVRPDGASFGLIPMRQLREDGATHVNRHRGGPESGGQRLARAVSGGHQSITGQSDVETASLDGFLRTRVAAIDGQPRVKRSSA